MASDWLVDVLILAWENTVFTSPLSHWLKYLQNSDKEFPKFKVNCNETDFLFRNDFVSEALVSQ